MKTDCNILSLMYHCLIALFIPQSKLKCCDHYFDMNKYFFPIQFVQKSCFIFSTYNRENCKYMSERIIARSFLFSKLNNVDIKSQYWYWYVPTTLHKIYIGTLSIIMKLNLGFEHIPTNIKEFNPRFEHLHTIVPSNYLQSNLNNSRQRVTWVKSTNEPVNLWIELLLIDHSTKSNIHANFVLHDLIWTSCR